MIPSAWKEFTLFRRAEFLSPRDLCQRALALSALFLLAHLAGWREYTSILNGTIGSVALGWNFSAFLGVIYICLYLGSVLLVPIFLLAAGLLTLWQAAGGRPNWTGAVKTRQIPLPGAS